MRRMVKCSWWSTPNGTVNWCTQFAQTVPWLSGGCVADIEKDQNDDLVMAGALLGTGVDLDPGPGQIKRSVPATTVMRIGSA
ncbi:MAG: hypothetical protein IPI41_12490 [Flavobacteriales bacterium]|nr:hypothetical protein [Flavobacteriales bacterium]